MNMNMSMFTYKEGVADVVHKLASEGVYGDIPELVKRLWTTRKEATDTWTCWWENYLLDAGLTDKQAVRFSKEMATYSAEQCGITLYHIDNEEQKEVMDVHTWQAELFRSREFDEAARALACLYNYCEEHGLINNEAIDEEGRAYRAVSLELRQIGLDPTQRTYVEIVLNDEASGLRVETMAI